MWYLAVIGFLYVVLFNQLGGIHPEGLGQLPHRRHVRLGSVLLDAVHGVGKILLQLERYPRGSAVRAKRIRSPR
jgi:hypothetical protein